MIFELLDILTITIPYPHGRKKSVSSLYLCLHDFEPVDPVSDWRREQNVLSLACLKRVIGRPILVTSSRAMTQPFAIRLARQEQRVERKHPILLSGRTKPDRP